MDSFHFSKPKSQIQDSVSMDPMPMLSPLCEEVQWGWAGDQVLGGMRLFCGTPYGLRGPLSVLTHHFSRTGRNRLPNFHSGLFIGYHDGVQKPEPFCVPGSRPIFWFSGAIGTGPECWVGSSTPSGPRPECHKTQATTAHLSPRTAGIILQRFSAQ
jgi:hypothetical protein